MDTDLSAVDASFWGEAGNDNAGWSVDGAGDVNNDGYPDIIIGAYQGAIGETYLILSPVLNTAPVAAAGDDQVDVAEGTTGSLSGECTDDDGGDTLTESWTQTGGTACVITGATDDSGVSPLTADASFTVPDISANETLTFQLECGDGTTTHTDTVNIGINAKPTATAQAVSTDEDTATVITLAGIDPDSEPLTFAIDSGPSHGNLSGLDVDTGAVTYTPTENYNGNDSFTFLVNDGIQDSDAAEVSIAVGSVNDAPVISDDEADRMVHCRLGVNCDLPGWTASDPDGDEVTITWIKVSGLDTLYFTDDWKIDLVNHQCRRGTYYLQMNASDGKGGSDKSILVEVSMPNNPPEIDVGGIVVEGTTCEGDRFVCSTFDNIMDIASYFSDFDDDILTYGWEVIGEEAGKDTAEIVSTEIGKSEICIRKAGTTTVEFSVDDGNGGVASERISIYEPLPEMNDIPIAITSWEVAGEYTSHISGQVESPVWPIVTVNGKDAAVTLPAPSCSDGDYETYDFTARDVPDDGNLLELSILILTDVDGEQAQLVDDTISAEDVVGDGPIARSAYYGGGGCSISTGASDVEGWLILAMVLLAAIVPRVIPRDAACIVIGRRRL